MSTHVKRHNRPRGKKPVEFLLPGENQKVGIVVKALGNGHVMVNVKDMPEINARVRGALAKRPLGVGTAVIIETYLNINNIIYIYPQEFMKELRKTDLLPTSSDSSEHQIMFDDNGGESSESEGAVDIDEI